MSSAISSRWAPWSKRDLGHQTSCSFHGTSSRNHSWRRTIISVPTGTLSRSAMSFAADRRKTVGGVTRGVRPLACACSIATPSPQSRELTNGTILTRANHPCPGRVSTRPSSLSFLIASSTVLRDALYWSLSSSSLGSCPPGLMSRERIFPLRSSAIRAYAATAIVASLWPAPCREPVAAAGRVSRVQRLDGNDTWVVKDHPDQTH